MDLIYKKQLLQILQKLFIIQMLIFDSLGIAVKISNFLSPIIQVVVWPMLQRRENVTK
jgi:hypothetical protein